MLYHLSPTPGLFHLMLRHGLAKLPSMTPTYCPSASLSSSWDYTTTTPDQLFFPFYLFNLLEALVAFCHLTGGCWQGCVLLQVTHNPEISFILSLEIF
jgi:hypothetical protein